MKSTLSKTPRRLTDRAALRRRVQRFYARLNAGDWEQCFALIDPGLRAKGRVDEQIYAESLQTFRNRHGAVRPWYIRINLHGGSSQTRNDPRPFAYVYVVWQDSRHEFHLFRERWVREKGRWYTRVAGLVA